MSKFLILEHLKIFFESLRDKLSPVAFSGDYEDLNNTPDLNLAEVAHTGDYDDLENKPTLSNVATSGSYNDLNNKPTIPTAGDYVTAGKRASTFLGNKATAEGYDVVASGAQAHAEGHVTSAIGDQAHTEGSVTQAIGNQAHAEGKGVNAFTFGAKYSAGDDFIITSYPSSKEIKTNQIISIIKNSTTYYGYIYDYNSSTDTISVDFKTAPSSLVEDETFVFTGYESGAYGNYTHVEGNGNTAIGEGAHAEGHNNKAVGVYSHVEGQGARASGAYSHAEGETTAATGTHSHAEGSGSIASGQYSHAEGHSSKALAYASHAEGLSSTADGYYAHAEGENTVAKHRAQHVFGKYNIEDPATSLPLEVGTYVEIVGNGEHNARSNARTLDWNGNEVLAGTLTTSSSGITIGNTTITEAQLQALLNLLSDNIFTVQSEQE